MLFTQDARLTERHLATTIDFDTRVRCVQVSQKLNVLYVCMA
jgi:hypothetical protein